MAFHFPLIAAHLHGGAARVAVSDFGDPGADPEIPDMAQWGIFLPTRRADAEMVSDEERDYMLLRVRQGPADEANVGIRRRLAPLLDNDRNQIELFTALLMSLPGSPVLYYGDEIGRAT